MIFNINRIFLVVALMLYVMVSATTVHPSIGRKQQNACIVLLGLSFISACLNLCLRPPPVRPPPAQGSRGN